MDLQVTSTSKIFYGVDALLGGILCEAFPEAFKRVERPAQSAQRGPKFFVRLNSSTDKPEIVLTTMLGETVYPGPGIAWPGYGDADEAAAAFKKMGFSVPLEVLAAFTEAVEKKLAQNIAAENRAVR